MPVFSQRLSRWTPVMFAVALGNFVAALALAASGAAWPVTATLAGPTLAAVHLVTIGYLTLLMFGALFQFVPVITARPLGAQQLSLATLLLVEAGLAAMVAGFVGPVYGAGGLRWCLPAGGALVVAGICCGAVNVLVPLLAARPLSLPARFVLAGQAFLLVTVLLGLSLALSLALPTHTAAPGRLLAGGVGYHALAGLAGWLTLTAMGVSYKLLPMFLLAPEERGAWGESVFVLGTAGTALAFVVGLAGLWPNAAAPGWLQGAGRAALGAAILLYLGDVVRMYRARRRARIELHNRAAAGAFASLAAALALGVIAALTGRVAGLAPALALLLLLGWLGGLGLTQLYKIVAFLTWLGRYGSGLGRGGVPPRVQDLVDDRRARPAFALYFGGVWLACLAAVAGETPLCRVGLVLALLATLALAYELLCIRRGRHVGMSTTSEVSP